MSEKSRAHAHDFRVQASHPDGVDWRPAAPPDIYAGRTTGRLRSCSWCGSMHPAELAAAIKAGATVSWADRKYGWPHKVYVDRVPNPHAGMLESRMSTSHAHPVCPKSGARCEHSPSHAHGQSFHGPECECMRERQADITKGVTSEGRAVIAVHDGYSCSTGKPEKRWIATGEPAGPTTDGKFYTLHLQDAAPEDRAVIERAMGLAFTFEGSSVSWRAFRADEVTS